MRDRPYTLAELRSRFGANEPFHFLVNDHNTPMYCSRRYASETHDLSKPEECPHLADWPGYDLIVNRNPAPTSHSHWIEATR